MRQLEFTNSAGEQKKAYEFDYSEFDLIISGLVLYGHPAKQALIKSNDTRVNIRPHSRHAVRKIEQLGALADQFELSLIKPTEEDNYSMSAEDRLRLDREEVIAAIIDNQRSGLQIQEKKVYLGLYSTAQAFDQLRVPYATSSRPDLAQQAVLLMMNQFYAESVDRIAETV